MSKLLQSRTLLIALIIATLFIYSKFNHPNRSVTQQEFDKWLELRKQTLLYSSPNSMAILPKLALEIHKDQSTENKVLTLDNVPTDEQRQRITRLLELMSASNIFSTVEGTDLAQEVSISVEDGDKRFLAKVSEATLNQNVSAQLMLKLFEEYSTGVNAQPKGGVVFDSKA